MTKIVALLVVGLFGSVMTYQVINRLPADALNVAVGVLCGITASIPVSLGLMIALLRRRDAGQPEADSLEAEPESITRAPRQPQPPQQPQIIVIAPPQGQFPQGNGYGVPLSNFGYPYAPASNETIEARDWRIIGEEE